MIDSILGRIKTAIEDLGLFTVEIYDRLDYDSGRDFIPDDSRQNLVKLRIVPDDEGRDVRMTREDGSWQMYRVEADCQLLCNYTGSSRAAVMDSILTKLYPLGDIRSASWDAPAIVDRLTGQVYTGTMDLILIDFVAFTITDLTNCETLNIGECS